MQGNVEREEHQDIGQDTDRGQRYQASTRFDYDDDQGRAQQKSTLSDDRNQVPAQVSRQAAQKSPPREPNRETDSGDQNDLPEQRRIRGDEDEQMRQCGQNNGGQQD